MNTEYVWWLLALLLAGGGMVAFLALGQVPEIDDERAEEVLGLEARAPTGIGRPQSSPESTTVPGPDAPASTSETP